jgi:prepilin-type N-terminal cleavage/methylation domain-containing protein
MKSHPPSHRGTENCGFRLFYCGIAGLPWDKAIRFFFAGQCESEKMNSNKGLTIFEVLVVLGILAIVSAFVTPNIMNWRRGVQLRGAASNLKGDLEMAKARAIRENDWVAVLFNASGYTVFIDNGAGGGIAGDWIRQGSELQLKAREMPVGVTIDIPGMTFNNKRTRFSGRGHCAVLGSAKFKNEKGDSMTITVNRLEINLKKGS